MPTRQRLDRHLGRPTSAAAARSRSHVSRPFVGRTRAAGSALVGSFRTAFNTLAFSPPATRNITRAAVLITGNVNVNRWGMEAALACTAATGRNTSFSTGEPGNSEPV